MYVCAFSGREKRKTLYIQYLQGFRLYYVVFIHQRAFVSLQAALFLVGGGSVIPQAGTASSLFEAASRSPSEKNLLVKLATVNSAEKR